MESKASPCKNFYAMPGLRSSPERECMICIFADHDNCECHATHMTDGQILICKETAAIKQKQVETAVAYARFLFDDLKNQHADTV